MTLDANSFASLRLVAHSSSNEFPLECTVITTKYCLRSHFLRYMSCFHQSAVKNTSKHKTMTMVPAILFARSVFINHQLLPVVRFACCLRTCRKTPRDFLVKLPSNHRQYGNGNCLGFGFNALSPQHVIELRRSNNIPQFSQLWRLRVYFPLASDMCSPVTTSFPQGSYDDLSCFTEAPSQAALTQAFTTPLALTLSLISKHVISTRREGLNSCYGPLPRLNPCSIPHASNPVRRGLRGRCEVCGSSQVRDPQTLHLPRPRSPVLGIEGEYCPIGRGNLFEP